MWIVDGIENALRMAWEVWWALVLGFTLSGIVQAWVPRGRLERTLGGRGPRQVGLATALGAAMSSPEGAAVQADVPNYATGGAIVLAYEAVGLALG